MKSRMAILLIFVSMFDQAAKRRKIHKKTNLACSSIKRL